MAQLSRPKDPFGEVNVYKKQDKSLEITATILKVPDIEGAVAGIALDASASMNKMYGITGLSDIFQKAAGNPNVVAPVVKTMTNYLGNFSSQGKATLIYWACGPDGSKIEEIGTFSGEEVEKLAINGPKKEKPGRATKLLPPLKYFVEQAFKDSKWAIVIFVTDGIIDDLNDVKKYSLEFAKEISSGKRNFIKLVLIGVGEEVDEGQMEELDDMFEGGGMKDPNGHDIDLWDHKLAGTMQKIEEIFAEVVTEDTIVASTGRILGSGGHEIKSYTDGLPARLHFTLPAGSTSFTLEFPGGKVTQDITEGS